MSGLCEGDQRTCQPAAESKPSGAIHIEFPGRAIVSVESGADPVVLPCSISLQWAAARSCTGGRIEFYRQEANWAWSTANDTPRAARNGVLVPSCTFVSHARSDLRPLEPGVDDGDRTRDLWRDRNALFFNDEQASEDGKKRASGTRHHQLWVGLWIEAGILNAGFFPFLPAGESPA